MSNKPIIKVHIKPTSDNIVRITNGRDSLQLYYSPSVRLVLSFADTLSAITCLEIEYVADVVSPKECTRLEILQEFT